MFIASSLPQDLSPISLHQLLPKRKQTIAASAEKLKICERNGPRSPPLVLKHLRFSHQAKGIVYLYSFIKSKMRRRRLLDFKPVADTKFRKIFASRTFAIRPPTSKTTGAGLRIPSAFPTAFTRSSPKSQFLKCVDWIFAQPESQIAFFIDRAQL